MDFDQIANNFKCLIIGSDHCFYCFDKESNKRLAIVDPHPEDKHIIEPYERLGCPVCTSCYCLGEEGMDSAKLSKNALFALENFDWTILNKEFQ